MAVRGIHLLQVPLAVQLDRFGACTARGRENVVKKVVSPVALHNLVPTVNRAHSHTSPL